MATQQGILRVNQEGLKVTFQVEGPATMHQGYPLREFAEQALAQGCDTIRVDLRHCTYVDSTFMGTLLFLHRGAKQQGNSFALICPSLTCQRLFREMTLDKIYPVASEEELPAAAWAELKTGLNDAYSFTTCVVEAHQELAKLSGPTGETFQRVVRCFENDAQVREERARSPDPASARPVDGGVRRPAPSA